MGQYKTEAILLAVRDYGDADRMVTLFSRDLGKITAAAYGARRPRSRLSGTVQPFVHADLELTAGRGLDAVKQCDIRQSFREIRGDLSAVAYANFLAELTGELCPEREAEPAVFELLLAGLGLLTVRNPRIVALAFAWQLLALAGFGPQCRRCVGCGAELAFPARFDVSAGGGICPACTGAELIEYNEEVAGFIERLLGLDWQDPGHFSVSGATLVKTEQLLAAFIAWRLDRPLKSLAFIAAVNVG